MKTNLELIATTLVIVVAAGLLTGCGEDEQLKAQLQAAENGRMFWQIVACVAGLVASVAIYCAVQRTKSSSGTDDGGGSDKAPIDTPQPVVVSPSPLRPRRPH